MTLMETDLDSGSGMDAMRVLVVDDNPSHAELVGHCLDQSAGYAFEVVEARHAEEARNILAADRIDLSFIDYKLGAITGLDLVKAIRDSGDRRPIIVMTAHGDEYLAVEMIRAGADDYLCKADLSPQRVGRAIDRVMERRRERAEAGREHDEIIRRLLTLTRREREVLRLIVDGLMNKQIADALHRSEKTVKIHRSNIMHKMQANTAAELVRMVLTAQLGHEKNLEDLDLESMLDDPR